MGALAHTLWRIKIPPGRFCLNHLGPRGLHPTVRSRAASGESKYPLADSVRITRGFGGYTRRVRSRAPSGESKYPSGDSIQITQGLRGYTRWVRSRAPSSESKYPRAVLSNHPGARGLHPSGALARTLWRIEIPSGRFYSNHPGTTVGDLILGYPMRWD